MEVIKERYPNGAPLYGVPDNSRVKYRLTFNEAEEALKEAGIRTNNELDQRFRKKFARLKKKWVEEHTKT